MVERHSELRWELFEDPHLARLASDFRDFKDWWAMENHGSPGYLRRNSNEDLEFRVNVDP